MGSKPNILFLPKWYPTEEKPLDGIFIQRHAKAIQSYANVIVLYAEVRASQNQDFFKTDTSEDGIRVIRYYYKKRFIGIEPIDKIFRLRLYFRCMHLGWEYIAKDIKIDVLHAHVLLRTGIFAHRISKKFKIPFVVTEHWTGYLNDSLHGLKRLLTKRILKKSSAVTVVSKPLKAAIEKMVTNLDCKTIPNVVDTQVFKPDKTQIRKVHIILHVSDLKDEHKNISGLIRTVENLSKKRQDFKLYIVGGGDERARLEWMSKRLKLHDKYVYFLGELSPNEVIEKMQQCRFLSLFSNYETFGVVLIEAMACGKPVVASNLEAIRGFISNDYGILVKPGSEYELEEAFNYMLNNYDKFNPEKLHRYVMLEYSYDQVGKKFSKVYDDVLKENKNA